jgi:uncharacterized cupredoxin-like copper-binding protein
MPLSRLATAVVTASLALGVAACGGDAADKVSDTAADAADSAKSAANDAADSAKSTAGDAADSAKSTAEDAADSAKSTAEDAADSAKSTAGDAADTAKSTAEDAADTARSTAEDAKDEVSGATTKRTIVMRDDAFSPARVSVSAGRVEITARNAGESPHELVLLRTRRAPGSIPLEDGKASEAASVGEIGVQQPGDSGSRTFDLKPGRYVFLCNVDGHYRAGMRGRLVVR